jgi:aspartokinase
MGKESSNLTATLLGSLLNAHEVVIFTDVEGVRSADPHLTENTLLRPHLTYEQARVAAHHGLKLLYPTMIDPAANAGLRIRIASAENPTGGTTVIDGADGACMPIVIINHDDADAEITTVFIACSDWLPAVSAVVQSLHRNTPCDIHTSHADQTAVLRVPAHVASEVARVLHQELSLRNTTL